MDKKINPAALRELKEKLKEAGQNKLAGQLEYLFGFSPAKPSSKSATRADLLSLMDKFRKKAFEFDRLENKDGPTYFDILISPVDFKTNINPGTVREALEKTADIFSDSPVFYRPDTDSAPEWEDDRVYAYQNNPDGKKNLFGYWLFTFNTAALYVVHSTGESIRERPEIFDPKIESCMIADLLIAAGSLYKWMSFRPQQSIDMVLRYENAGGLSVGSLGEDYFLPSRKYQDKSLSLYVVRPLYNLLGRTPEITADIILELLKRLHYQGIVNRNYFLHAVAKHIGKDLKLSK